MSNNLSIQKNVPQRPGCYIFKDNSGEILYIGKAKDLRKRVSSYFTKNHEDGKTEILVRNIFDVDYIVTRDEVEALKVEAELIKKHQPKYNIDLKSGERYAYIRVTDEEFPRLETARNVKKGEKVFGPYTNSDARKASVRLVNQLFVLRVCKNKTGRRCLLSHINACACPYANKMSKYEYNDRLNRAIMFLRGETKELLKKLKREMKEFAAKKDYEHAKVRRDQILMLEHISSYKPEKLKRIFDQDVIHFVETSKQFHVQMFNIKKGVISGKQAVKIKKYTGQKPGDILSEFIKQYYYSHDTPQEIIVPVKIEDEKNISKFLSVHSRHSVKISVPKKGEKKKLLDLLAENIRIRLSSGSSSLLDLQNQLSLSTLPRNIECFDVSNLGEKFKVGSMVHFTDGKPDKSKYRRFKIKTVQGQSDFDCMKEIVFRRYYRLVQEGAVFPQLVCVDGGKPQLSASMQAFKELGVSVPLISLAKKKEEIFSPERAHSLRLSKKSPALKLLQTIRDEAHRFAITYNRLLRSKQIIRKK